MSRWAPLLLPVISLLLVGCNRQNSLRINYQMGERVTVGTLTYNVVETVWRSQLGDMFRIRVPQQRFLLITISVTNSGGRDVSIPLLTLEGNNGETFRESDSGEGIDNWFGLLRTLNPAQTQQGRLLFDVPLTSYRLRLTDGAGPVGEKYAWVEIPLRMDIDTSVASPLPGMPVK